MIERIREQTSGFTIDAEGPSDCLVAEGNLIDLILFCQMSRMSSRVEELIDVVIGAAGGDATIRGACEIVMMLASQIRGDLDAADAAMARGRAIYDTVQLSRYGHTQIVGHEVLVLMARGRLRKSLELIARYQKQSDFEVRDDISTPTLLKLILATIRYEQEFSDSAVDAMKQSLAQHSITESWFDQYAIVYPALVLRLWLTEGSSAVFAFIDDARQQGQRRGLAPLPDFLTCLEIEYRARMGDVVGAEKLAAELDLDARSNPVGALAESLGWREREAALQAAIRLAIAQQSWDRALAFARSLARAGRSGGRLRTEIKGHVFSALVQCASGSNATASTSLLDAVLLAYPEGFVAPFSEEGMTLDAQIETLMTENIDAYARRHLETIRRTIGSSMVRPDRELLNLREREIVGHLAEGLSNKVIARRMGITDHTVKFHLKKIFSKLKVSRRRDAVAKILAAKSS